MEINCARSGNAFADAAPFCRTAQACYLPLQRPYERARLLMEISRQACVLRSGLLYGGASALTCAYSSRSETVRANFRRRSGRVPRPGLTRLEAEPSRLELITD